MTESNTPPENPKKKSSFSRFFSRKTSSSENQVNSNAPSPDETTVLTTSATDVSPLETSSSDTPKPIGSTITEDQATSAEQIKKTTSTLEITSQTEATVEDGLDKSRNSFLKKISNVFKGSFDLSDDLFDELEELLITSDIGIEASMNLVEKLRDRVKNEKIQDAQSVIAGLRAEVTDMLKQSEQAWRFQQKPYVIVMVGVNGAGKTTTTAKIAKYFQAQGSRG